MPKFQCTEIVDWFLYDRDLRHERVKYGLFRGVFRTVSNI